MYLGEIGRAIEGELMRLKILVRPAGSKPPFQDFQGSEVQNRDIWFALEAMNRFFNQKSEERFDFKNCPEDFNLPEEVAQCFFKINFSVFSRELKLGSEEEVVGHVQGCQSCRRIIGAAVFAFLSRLSGQGFKRSFAYAYSALLSTHYIEEMFSRGDIKLVRMSTEAHNEIEKFLSSLSREGAGRASEELMKFLTDKAFEEKNGFLDIGIKDVQQWLKVYKEKEQTRYRGIYL